MLVSIIIVNYNTFDITCSCIESVIACTFAVPYEIVLVDNASPAENPQKFKLRFPGIKLIRSPENGGFAKGNNIGIKEASGNILLLLNSDTLLTEDSIAIAAKHLNEHEEIGALSVRLVYPDGKFQHTARKFRSIRNELLDLMRPLLLMMPYRKRSELMLNQYFKGERDVWADWVSGAFLMFRRSALERLPGGQLDERFFMYGEDQLWCYQLRKIGLRNYYLSQTTVIHINNASTSSEKQKKLERMMLENELKIMEYRKGLGIYYYAFWALFSAKEKFRSIIKRLVLKLFKRNIR